jgi:tetratricopeptide (TPR) repeat protein
MLLELSPLIRERDRLQKEIAQLSSETASLQTASVEATKALDATRNQFQQLVRESAAVNDELARVRAELDNTREALNSANRERVNVEQVLKRMRDAAIEQRQLAAKAQEASAEIVRRAVNAFHAKDYARAIATYDSALEVDPLNVYIINLKSYSQFKLAKLAQAVETMKSGLEKEPTYVHGYFDLARYQCAAGAPPVALETIKDALAKAVDRSDDPLYPKITKGAVTSALQYFLEEDGEFTRLCRSIVGDLRALVTPQR